MLLPDSVFEVIIAELYKRPLPNNQERLIAGTGKTQTFGVVNRRLAEPDYSRMCWKRPYLFHLLTEFGKTFVPASIEWNAITLNEDYQANPHYDRGNIGESFLVSFGVFTGGRLILYENNDLQKPKYVDIKNNPIVLDFSKQLHSVEAFEGKRFSLVYYKANPRKGKFSLPPYKIVEEDGIWKFYRGEEWINPKVGIPHPMKGKKVQKKTVEPPKPVTVTESVTVAFN